MVKQGIGIKTLGQKRSNYKKIGLVGQGQFGKVYCAIERRTGELRALKELDHNRFSTRQFLREFRLLISLHHPNIVACEAIEHGVKSRQMVMDYCEGGTLRNLLESESKLSLRHCLKIITDILQGLDYAHSRGIVHCDIKPENILLQLQSDGWLAKISDFGVARLQEEIGGGNGDTGSPAYMAPERFYGKHVYASDLYAVGVILYEMVVGERPFSGIPKELLQAHLSQPLQIPDTVPFMLRSTLTTALQKLPQNRFASASEMLKAIHLAEAVTVATSSNASLLTTTLTCQILPFNPIDQEVLTTPVTQLAIGNQLVILGKVKQAECRWYPGGVLKGDLKQTWRVGLNQSLEKTQQLAEIQLTQRGCWLLTKARLASTTEREFNLYFLPLTTSGLAQTVGIAQNQPELFTLMTLQAEQMRIAADPQGKWLAYGAEHQSQSANYLNILRGEHALSLQEQHTQILSKNLLALVALNQRYVLAIKTHSPEQQPGCCLQVFSRWGRSLGQFDLPIQVRQVTPNFGNPGQFLSLDATDPSIGVLVHLYPWKVERLALGIEAHWLQPTPWGYVVADEEGQVLLLNFYGEKLARFQIPGMITAFSSFDKFGLMVATWSTEPEVGGRLYNIDLSKLGFDFRASNFSL
jgi:serine/threonine protein kinase